MIMYCEKCGQLIPAGSDTCPSCTPAPQTSETFRFHFKSGMSSRTVTEIDHTITLQKGGIAITRQKTRTAWKRKSMPVETKYINYRDIERMREKTDLAPAEIPIALLCALFLLMSTTFIEVLIWIILAAISIKWALRTVLIIQLQDRSKIKIPHSGQKQIAVDFINAVQKQIPIS